TARDGLSLAMCTRGDGHLTEEALVAIADGQEALIPEAPRLHLDACEECARRLGDAAMLSSQVAMAFAAMPREEAAPVKVPVRMIPGALALATLGLLPSVLAAPSRVAGAMSWLTRSLPLFLRTFAQLFRGAEGGLGSLGVAMSVCATLVLMSLAFVIMKGT